MQSKVRKLRAKIPTDVTVYRVRQARDKKGTLAARGPEALAGGPAAEQYTKCLLEWSQ